MSATPNKKLLPPAQKVPLKPSTASEISTENEPWETNASGYLSNSHGFGVCVFLRFLTLTDTLITYSKVVTSVDLVGFVVVVICFESGNYSITQAGLQCMALPRLPPAHNKLLPHPSKSWVCKCEPPQLVIWLLLISFFLF